MKINGKIISSLSGLKQNFYLFEILSKLSVFERDMKEIYIANSKDKLFFHLAKAHFSETKIICDDGFEVPLNDSQRKISELESLSDGDRIMIISLFDLVGETEILDEQIEQIKIWSGTPFSEIANIDNIIKTDRDRDTGIDTIFLLKGTSIRRCCQDWESHKLETKKIIVPRDSGYDSFIDDVRLKPGEVTFGVFTEEGQLVKVSPKELRNSSFYLKFELLDDNKSRLIIQPSVGSKNIFETATFFGEGPNNDFMIIKNDDITINFLTAQNDGLRNRLKSQRGVHGRTCDKLVFFNYDHDNITVTLSSGEQYPIPINNH